MKAHASTDVIDAEAGDFHKAWEETRCWVRRVLCGKGGASAAVVIGASVASLGCLGLVQYKLHQLMWSWASGGAGVSVFALF